MNRLLTAFAVLLVSSTAQAGWVLDKVSGKTIQLKDDSGKVELLKTDVPSPVYVAVLSDPESNTPYVLYEGRACPNCDPANASLYLQRMDGKGKVTSFVYPGRITDPKKGSLVYQGRVFYGNCLPKVKVGVVAHQQETVDRRGTQKSVLIAEPGPQYVYEVLHERRLPNISATLDLVKQKVCFEIPGRSRTVLKRPLNLSPKKDIGDEEEEEEDKNDKKSPVESAPDEPNAGKD